MDISGPRAGIRARRQGGWQRQPNEVITLQKWQCKVCPYVYDPELGDPDNGIPPGTSFEDLPDDWLCPECVLGKGVFEPLE